MLKNSLFKSAYNTRERPMRIDSMNPGFRGHVGKRETSNIDDAAALANMKVLALGAMQNKGDCFVTRKDDKTQVTLPPKILTDSTVATALKNLLKNIFASPEIKPVPPVSLSVKGDEAKLTIYSGAGDSLTYTVKDKQQAADLKGMINAAERKF